MPVPVVKDVVAASWDFSQVTFVDAQHGFSYRPALYATDDGGMSWQTVSLGGAVTSLVVGRRFVSPQCKVLVPVQATACRQGSIERHETHRTGK